MDKNICGRSSFTNDLNILKKYFDYWKRLKNCEIPKTESNDRLYKFLELIQKEKEKLKDVKKIKSESKICMNDSDETFQNHILETKMKNHGRFNGKCENRLQVQTHTIALLKAQLEQKNRMIEELKLKKIVEDATMSSNLVNEFKNTLSQCSISVKPKMKCVIGEPIHVESSSEESLKIQCIKVPKFLQQMEHRARQREEKRKIVTERRKQIEYEKERFKEQMQIERQIKDQDERTKRINEFKEKHKKEQLLAIKRKEFAERLRSLYVMADLHFEKKLIMKYGFQTLKLFVIKVKEDNIMAIKFDEYRISRSFFVSWSNCVKKVLEIKQLKAQNFYENKLKVKAFTEMKKMHKTMLCKQYTAEDWYIARIVDKLFTIWKKNVIVLSRFRKKQWIIAILHYERNLQWKVIGCWQTLPAIMNIERDQEARKQRWRLKVQEVLPDFIPREIYK
ncbi:uncharacterized protein LOC143917294 [Arctopsyche grandis]|uniref:uncharacterized protein LOC143917294 n=1 Tax=Arctopsyche grandis TaxID=121162 RepID=UPI00406D9E28